MLAHVNSINEDIYGPKRREKNVFQPANQPNDDNPTVHTHGNDLFGRHCRQLNFECSHFISDKLTLTNIPPIAYFARIFFNCTINIYWLITIVIFTIIVIGWIKCSEAKRINTFLVGANTLYEHPMILQMREKKKHNACTFTPAQTIWCGILFLINVVVNQLY